MKSDIKRLKDFLNGKFQLKNPDVVINELKGQFEDPETSELLDVIIDLVSKASNLGALTGFAAAGTMVSYNEHRDMSVIGKSITLLEMNDVPLVLIIKMLNECNVPTGEALKASVEAKMSRLKPDTDKLIDEINEEIDKLND